MSINLMPWREARRKRVQKEFMTKIGFSAVAGLGLVVLMYAGLSATTAGQNKRNAFLETQIEDAKKSIEQVKDLEKQKSAMLNRKKVIESLQANRDQLAHLYYELATNTVDGVILNSMQEKNKIIEITGKSVSNSAVASFMNKIEVSPWFSNPEIVIIQNEEFSKSKEVNITDPGVNRYEYDFIIKTGVRNPNIPEEETEEGEGKKKSAKERHRAKTST